MLLNIYIIQNKELLNIYIIVDNDNDNDDEMALAYKNLFDKNYRKSNEHFVKFFEHLNKQKKSWLLF